jgi:hypothetical protein
LFFPGNPLYPARLSGRYTRRPSGYSGKKLTKVLGDTTNMKTRGSEAIAKLVDYWLPSAMEAGLKPIAVIESTNAFNQMTVNTAEEKIKPKQVIFKYFKNYEAARFRLLNC